MKVIAVSDLHGRLPVIQPCDVLLIAGDICPVTDHKIGYQRCWLDTTFRKWLTSVPAQRRIAVFGNHDLIGEEAPELVPDLPWTLLQDSNTTIDRGDDFPLLVWGLPWQKRFNDWAFNLDEPELDKKYESIEPCDIIVSHGPPLGYGDRAPRSEPPGYEDTGSKAFLKRIFMLDPKLVVFGHIHEGRGLWQYGETTLANVTHVDARYRPVYPPMVFEI